MIQNGVVQPGSRRR